MPPVTPMTECESTERFGPRVWNSGSFRGHLITLDGVAYSSGLFVKPPQSQRLSTPLSRGNPFSNDLAGEPRE